ncbi:MAG: DUF3108 domain-containing protein [Pseudomonadota bacterium]
MIRFATLFLFCSLAVPLSAEIRTQAVYTAKLYGATLATINLTGRTTDGRYSVSAELSTKGLVSALSDASYFGKVSGTRSGERFRPARYTETVKENGAERAGALVYQAGMPQPQGFKAEERGPDALALSGQGDTVDPLTGIFMVFRDQPAAEVCPPLRQFVFDGERRTVIELKRTAESADEITCAGQFRRVAGYAKDDRYGRRKVLPIELTYRRAGDLMQMQEIRFQTDYGPARLERR